MFSRRILTSLILFMIGVTLFWLVYKDFDTRELLNSLNEISFNWIFAAIGFGLFSHLIRAIRWGMLLGIMGYKPTTTNLFLSIIILYFTNLIVPRGGEISRCAILTKYENIPFVKMTGTVFIERITDLIVFILILLTLVIWQFSFFETIINYPDFKLDFSSLRLKIIPLVIGAIILGIFLYFVVHLKAFSKMGIKLKKLGKDFLEGIIAIKKLKNKIRYIVYTFMIFILWVLMLYAVFFAYPPTRQLSFLVAVLTFSFGTLAYLLPIQAGIGAWHFIVINCLFFYGVDKESGMIFALIAHTFTNLIFLVFGPIALGLLPLFNKANSDSLEINYEK